MTEVNLKFGDLVRYSQGRVVHQVRSIVRMPNGYSWAILVSRESGHTSSTPLDRLVLLQAA